MKLTQWILGLIFPPKCVLCGRLLQEEETDICHGCRKDVEEYRINRLRKLPFLDSWLGVWYYEDTVRRSILRFKFYGARGNADCYGRMLAMKLQQEYPDGFDILTWVPVSPLRKLTRGYDQVELIARAVARELQMEPTVTLKKIRHNKPQSGIREDAHRRANVLGVYRAVDPERLRDKTILLLDDVITTGSTLNECARVLRTAGCARVFGGAVAVARRNGRSKQEAGA